MHGISLLPVMRGETDTVREVAIAGYYGMSWSLITKDWSYIHWLKNDIDTDEMNRLFYDGSGKGGNAGRQSAELEMKEEMWTCVQGAEVTVPEQDELYDRRADPFQLNNLAGEHPEKAKELLQQLKLYIGELRTCSLGKGGGFPRLFCFGKTRWPTPYMSLWILKPPTISRTAPVP